MSETHEPSILTALAPTAAAASATSLRRECRTCRRVFESTVKHPRWECRSCSRRRNGTTGEEQPSPMNPPLSRAEVLAMIEVRLAAGASDAWLLKIERDVLIAIGRQSPRSGW